MLASITSVCVLLARTQKSGTCGLELGIIVRENSDAVHFLFGFSRQDLAIQISLAYNLLCSPGYSQNSRHPHAPVSPSAGIMGMCSHT